VTQRPYGNDDLRAQAALYMDHVEVSPLVVLSDMADEESWRELGADDFNGAHSAALKLIRDGGVTRTEEDA
jgi:hypothetical protein